MYLGCWGLDVVVVGGYEITQLSIKIRKYSSRSRL